MASAAPTVADDYDPTVRQSEREETYASNDHTSVHKLSDFAIGKPLGRGRFGRVYMARHKEDFLVALKLLSKNELVKCRMEQQVTREIEIHNQLQHPNIVEFLGYFTDPRKIYLIFEFCYNGELYGFVQKKGGKLSVARTATYLYQAADALRYAHSKNVIHRDIKPENMLLGMFEDVKLSDFGWGVHDRKGKRRTICGTLDYLPPEMINRDQYNDNVDEWCLGILCYELLHGSPPFESNNEKTTKDNITKYSYRFPSGMNPAAKDLIGKLLVPSRDRISMTAIIEHPFVSKNLDARFFDPEDSRLGMIMKK